MNRILRITSIVALASLSQTLWAAEGPRPVDEHRPLKPDAAVTISNVAGIVDVEAWDKNELALTGELAEEAESLDITGTPSDLRIEVKLPKNTRDVGDTQLRLRVPVGVHLSADTVSADVRVRGLSGPVKAKSVSGDLQLKVGSARVEAETVSGRVAIDAPASVTRVQTVSGDVSVRGPKGEFHGETVSGDLRLQAREIRKFSAETVSGDIELDLELAKDAEVTVETLSGTVAMTLPALPEGTLEMESFSGELQSAWSGVEEDAKEYRHEGSGKNRVRLHSFSGDIHLKKG